MVIMMMEFCWVVFDLNMMLMIMMMTDDVHQKCEHFGLGLGLATAGLDYILSTAAFCWNNKCTYLLNMSIPCHILLQFSTNDCLFEAIWLWGRMWHMPSLSVGQYGPKCVVINSMHAWYMLTVAYTISHFLGAALCSCKFARFWGLLRCLQHVQCVYCLFFDLLGKLDVCYSAAVWYCCRCSKDGGNA